MSGSNMTYHGGFIAASVFSTEIYVNVLTVGLFPVSRERFHRFTRPISGSNMTYHGGFNAASVFSTKIYVNMLTVGLFPVSRERFH